MFGMTVDLTVVQKTLIDTLRVKLQRVIAKRAVCSLSAVSELNHGKLARREKCVRKRCRSQKDVK